nr:uncharacterized protein LOC104090907 isoform X4 [Nicotiana tomentosiformis]
MGEQSQPNALETQWAFLGGTNDSYYLAGHELNKQCMAGVGIDGMHYVSVPSPQWIHDQQTPQNYVEYLAENVVSEVQVDASAEASGFRLVDSSADIISQEQIRYPSPYFEGVPLDFLIGSESQVGALTWEPAGDARLASGPCSEALAAGSSYLSKSSRKARAALSDQRRKMRIAERIDALGELFPCSKKVTHPYWHLIFIVYCILHSYSKCRIFRSFKSCALEAGMQKVGEYKKLVTGIICAL